MILKIINSLLIALAVFMGFKQGWGMIAQTAEMLQLFQPWNFVGNGLIALGAVTVLSAMLILFHKTFILGNLLMAATILVIIGFHLYYDAQPLMVC